jgi:outer membrane lipoprotein SlyB
MKKLFFFILSAAAMLAMLLPAAHAGDWDIGASQKGRQEALKTGTVSSGVVLQVRTVDVAPSGAANTVSTTVGGIVGGALGSKMGQGNGRYVAATLGAILGGVAGNMAGEQISSAKAQEIIVKKEDGTLVSVTQAQSDLRPGEPVFLIQEGGWGNVRVIPRGADM